MSNFFEQAKEDVGKLQRDLLGPDYSYPDQIKNPEELGMGGDGSTRTIGNNIKGLKSYVEVLITGTGKGSKTGGPLGDKFFLETGAKCKDVATNGEVTRSIFVNNIPDGSIPFITHTSGVRVKALRGLVPGMLTNVSNINPMQIVQAFMIGSTPDCQSIKMETVDANNNKISETGYVTNTDISALSACLFPNRQNPITNKKCQGEGFQNVNFDDPYDMPEDNLIKIYYSALGLLGIYILFKLNVKSLKLK